MAGALSQKAWAVCAVAVAMLLALPVPTASLAWAAEELGGIDGGGDAASSVAGEGGGPAGDASAVAEAPLQSEGDESEASAYDADAIDVTAQWREGSLILDQAGTYVLTDDITAGGTLFIAAPIDETIILDFNGHVVTVDSAARAIDVVSSYGSVVITDSHPRYMDEGQGHDATGQEAEGDAEGQERGADDLQACLILEADDMTESVYGITYKTPDVSSAELAALGIASDGEAAASAPAEGEDSAAGSSPDAAFSLTLENIAVEVNAVARTREALGYDAVGVFADAEGDRAQAKVTPQLTVRNSALRVSAAPELDDENAVDDVATTAYEAGGVTCALFVGAGAAHLEGSFSAEAAGAGETWDLLSAEKDAFVWEEGFSACDELAINEGGAAEEAEALAVAASAAPSGDVCDANGEGVAGDGAAPNGDGIAPQAADTDLNAAWKASGFSSSYSITQGGRYYLSADLNVSTTLEINAPDQEVTLDLSGHSLTIQSLSSQGYGINIKAAKKVTITGNSAAASKLFFNSAAITYAISSAADELVVNGITVQSRAHDDYLMLKDLFATSIYATRGAVSVSNCELVVDLSNQGNATVTSNDATKRGPAAIYLGANVVSARVENTSVRAVNSPVVSVRDASDIAGVGYAYGLYSLTSANVEVSGCTFDVTSALGSAVGAYGKNLTFSGATTMRLSAASQALGINSAATGAVKLNGSLSVSYASSAADVRAALYSLTQNAFVLGSGFAGSNLSAWVGSSDTANDDGVRIASFDAGVDAGAKARLGGMITNARGSSAACTVATDEAGVYFALQMSRAQARLTHNGADTLFATFASAVAAAQPGDTITLLADADDLTMNKVGTAALVITVDLNGHAVKSFTNKSSAKVVLTSSVAGGQVKGRNDSTGAAVTYSGTTSMAIRDIDIVCVSSTLKTCGLLSSGTGLLELENVNIVASSERTEARGINQTNSGGGSIALSGGSVSAATASTGVAAYGITSSSTKGTLSLDNCPVDVQGTSATVSGIDVKASLSIAGNASETSVCVRIGGSSTNAWGIRVASNTARATLTDASVVVESAAERGGSGTGAAAVSATQYWCLTSSTSSADFSASWVLDGSCLLESSTGTEISHSKKALQLKEGFSARGSSIAIASKNLGGATFASLAQGSAAASELARVFKPAPGSTYADWSASAQSAGEQSSELSWSHADVVRNTSTGTSYASVAQALSQAKDGETLQLLSNCAVYEALDVTSSITLDLAGKTLSVNLAKAMAAESCAVKVSAAGAVAIRGGTVSITLGRNPETATSARTPYEGIEVAGAGSLSVSNCAVNVTYAGSSSTEPEVTLYAIAVSSGSLSLDGSTRVVAQAAQEKGAFGAQTVAGVYLSGTKTEDALSVASSATVRAENNAASIVQGEIGYPEGNVTGTNAENNANLIELDVEEGSDLDQEIQAQFLVKAKFDSKGDAAGYEHGAQIYYASAMELPSGLVVWAYSDPVDAVNEGKLASICATHVFVRSDYTVPSDAFGVAAASGFAGTAEVAGSVSASTTTGHAYGVYRSKGGTWNVASSKVTATCGNGAYRANLGKLNLADYIDFSADIKKSASEKGILYPEDASYREVAMASPVAQSVVTRGSELEQNTLGPVAYDELYANVGSTVSVRFTNMKTAAGDAAAGRIYTVTWGQTLAEAGIQMPTPSDYRIGDVTYRFVGWINATSSSGEGAYDARSLYTDYAVDATMQGVTDGEAVFVASYAPVLEGQCLITFRVDDLLYAYAIDAGTSPSFADAYGAADRAVPSLSDASTIDGHVMTFKGWATGSLDDLLMREGTAVNAGVLPAASADATYTAVYETTSTKIGLALYYMRLSESGYVYSADLEEHFDWKGAEGNALAEADERVKVGDTFTQDGTTYTFLGWSERQSDKEPLYVDELPVEGHNDMRSTDKVTFYGIYESSEKLYTVLFYVGDELYATASNVAASKTLSAAFAASDNPENPTSSEEGVTFRGWNTDASATSYLYANMTKLSEIAESEGDSIELHAIWRQPSSTNPGTDDPDNSDKPSTGEPVVTFYDSDRSTVVDTLAVNTGETVYKSTGENPKPRGEKADLFLKWVDEDGNDFSVTETPVSASMKVYAVYFQDNSGTGVLGGSGTGGTGGTGGVVPAASTTNAKLASSPSGGGLAASNNGGNADGDGEADNAAGEGDAAVLAASANASQTPDADATAQADDGAMPEAGEDANNVAGVVLVIVAVLAIIGGVAWWFLRRRAVDAREAAEDEAEEEAAVAAAASGQVAAEGIRF